MKHSYSTVYLPAIFFRKNCKYLGNARGLCERQQKEILGLVRQNNVSELKLFALHQRGLLRAYEN